MSERPDGPYKVKYVGIPEIVVDYWALLGPDGKEIDGFHSQGKAQKRCDELNEAYRLGKASRRH